MTVNKKSRIKSRLVKSRKGVVSDVKNDKRGKDKPKFGKIQKKEAKKQPTSAKAQKGKSMKELYGEQEVKIADSIKPGKKEKKIRRYGNAYKVLVKPLITEKAANLGAENKYVFEVSTSANKIEIAKAINEVYGIMPVNVNVINVQGKKVRSGRLQGKRKNWKKAIVMLPKGKTINIYEGV